MVGASTVFIVLAALFWGLSGGLGGILIAHGWDPFVVSFYRGAIGFLCIVIWLVLRPQSSGLASCRLWFWSVIAGLGVAGNFAFYFLSIGQGSIAVAATLMYCAPIFVYIVSFVLKLESPTLAKWAAISLVMIGIVLLTQIYDIGASDITLIGVAAGLLSGLSYAIFIFGFKYAAPHGSPQAILAIAFAVLSIILIWPGNAGQMAAALSTSDWLLFVILGVFGAGLSFVLYIIGLNQTTPAVASIVAMVEPVTASLFGVMVLNQTLVGTQVAGMVLILLTVAALNQLGLIRSMFQSG